MKAFCIALLGGALISSPAVSGVRIAWNDLDISTPSGARTLHERIDREARRACAFSLRRHQRIFDSRGCRAKFHEEAVSLMPERARETYLAARTPSESRGR